MRISFRNLTLLEVRLEFSKKYYFAHLCFRYCEFLVFYRLLASESLQALISIPTYHTGEHSLHAANSSCHFLVVNILQFYMACLLILASGFKRLLNRQARTWSSGTHSRLRRSFLTSKRCLYLETFPNLMEVVFL